MPALFMSSYLWCLLLLAVSAVFATLHQAFTITGQAGLERLEDRLPAAGGPSERWAARWPRMRSALLLAQAFTQAGALAFAAAGLFAPSPAAADIAFFAAVALASALVLELLPRALSEGYADVLSLRLLFLAVVLAFLLWPLAAPAAWLERRLARALRAKTDADDRPTAEDAIMSLVEQAPGGDLEDSERRMIRRVFELGDTRTREIMTPRVDIVALNETERVLDGLARAAAQKYSRYPVTRGGSLDAIGGVAHIKDLALAVAGGRGEDPVGAWVKPALFVAESMPIGDLLDLMRARREHLAIVADEYGGTAGLVTMEDAIEELVGEIRDEFDEDERDVAAPTGDVATLDARTPIGDVNETMGAALPEDAGFDTIGGYLAHALGRIPRKGDVVAAPGVLLTVESATARRALRVRVERRRAEGEAPRAEE